MSTTLLVRTCASALLSPSDHPKSKKRSAARSMSFLMSASSRSLDASLAPKSADPVRVSPSADSCFRAASVESRSASANDVVMYSPSEEVAEESEGDGFLTRCLEGKKATDIRLTTIAFGTSTHGVLGKLMVRGSNSTRGVTDIGITAISRGCPSLKALSLWNVDSVTDENTAAAISFIRLRVFQPKSLESS